MKNKTIKVKKDKKNLKRKLRLSNLERKNRNKLRISKFSPFKNFKSFISDSIHEYRNSVIIKPNDNFELLKNPQEVISFIHELKSFKYRKDVEYVRINLENVKTTDIGAISLLLSSVEELSLNGKNVSGSVPKEKNAYDILAESGFFKNISKVSKRIDTKLKTNNNRNLLLIGNAKTRLKGRLIGECIKSSIGVLTGSPKHYKPIYTIAMEMNANSIEHAYEEEEKHWVFGINYKQHENKLYFTFTDNGLGILKQLDLKLSKVFAQFLKDCNYSNELLLKNLFDKKYNSRFKNQINRNRGLPIIQEKTVNGFVNNLICITNDVYLNLKTKDSIKLNDEFSGTFYYWELDLDLFEANERDFN